MGNLPSPRVIVVYVMPEWNKTLQSLHLFCNAGCLVHACILPDITTYAQSYGHILLESQSLWAPKVKAAYDFVVSNYRTGDHVVWVPVDKPQLLPTYHLSIGLGYPTR
ncbi:hypothetical protein BDV93DRAFT_366391 [Ceratobasidium sp. AG-I]|nr:hypothetical protein BDV93DRAFT_366391 [Ceratobasidium sp. AG-I]